MHRKLQLRKHRNMENIFKKVAGFRVSDGVNQRWMAGSQTEAASGRKTRGNGPMVRRGKWWDILKGRPRWQICRLGTRR